MKISRRQVIRGSGTALAGLSLGLRPERALAFQAPAQPPQPPPDKLVPSNLRTISELPLRPDGSAPEHPESAAGAITGVIWRYTNRKPPAIDFDYRNLKVKLDVGGTAKQSGLLRFSDLEALPRHSQVTLLQCGAATPKGIVKWTGVRFSDVAKLLEVQPFAAYCRFVGSDTYWVEEEFKTMMHPQVMLAWLMNDKPIPPENGAPLRLVIPFRYGGRNVKAITEIFLSATTFALPKMPPPAAPAA